MTTYDGDRAEFAPLDAKPSAASVVGLARSRLHELAAEYEITRELGRGGTAVVYHARERALGREVAIKVVHQTHVNDAEAVARLAREARLVAQLRHPNIVTLFGTRALADGSLALIMQFVPGRTLKQAIQEDGPLPIAVVESVLREMAMALQHAHQRQGLVHRDIKPENIYLDIEGGRTLLSDFGIARTTEIESSLTLVGTALGTPAYMSPEQIDGLPLDGRSDLYSLGLVAYEMLTGQKPWDGHNLYTIIYRQKHEELPPLSEFRNDVTPQMKAAIHGLLRKDRNERWPDAGRFLAALRPCSGSGAIAPPAITQRQGIRGQETLPVPDDSPTIAYRLQDDPDISSGTLSAGSSAGHAASTSQEVARVVRFLLDDDGNAAAEPVAAKPRMHRRRTPLLIGLAVLLAAAGAMAPLIATDEENSGEVPGRGQRSLPTSPAGLDESASPATAAGGSPAQLVVLTDQQTGYVGEPLSVPVGLVVNDADGRPVPGAAVELEVVAGGGRVVPEMAVSDSGGLAMVRWTLGEVPGGNELNARVPGLHQTTVSIRATGVAGPVARMGVVRGDDQMFAAGYTLPDSVVVRLEDARGNPVAGARVEFTVRSGGGTVHPAVALSDSAGQVRTAWAIGSVAGNTLRATLPGSDLHVEVTARTPTPQARIVAGGTHTCLLQAAGGISCWGANDNGQLGPDGAEGRIGAAAVHGASPFTRLAAGISHSCALDRNGQAHCWGANDAGQLGAGDQNARATLAAVGTPERLVALTAGLNHSCALGDDGSALCWGEGSSGQTGDGAATGRSSPVRVAGGQTFTSLSAGWRHTCGLTRGNIVYCWGSNSDGQLGDGTSIQRASPVRLAGDLRLTGISTGAAHSCGVTAAGDAFCWGQNGSGQLGSGSTISSARPTRVQASAPFVSITTGAVHTCALTRTGEAYCWGRNNFGQLGNNSTPDSPVPVRVADGLRFTFLTASGSHTCGRADSGDYYCWGYNVNGQLGDATRTNRSRPVRVSVAGR